MEEDEYKLSPCPFCGILPKLLHVEAEDELDDQWYIDHSCLEVISNLTIPSFFKDEIIERWNELSHGGRVVFVASRTNSGPVSANRGGVMYESFTPIGDVSPGELTEVVFYKQKWILQSEIVEKK